MSSRKVADMSAGGESQKQTSAAAKAKQKKISNAADTPPGPVMATKKTAAKKAVVNNKVPKPEQKNAIKTPKAMKKIAEKEFEEREEKKDPPAKKTVKQKLKEKLITKTVKKPLKEAIKKGSKAGGLTSAGNADKCAADKSPPKPKKKATTDDKDEKKPKEKVPKEKKAAKESGGKDAKETTKDSKDTKKKQGVRAMKKTADPADADGAKPAAKPDKKASPKKTAAAAKVTAAKSKGKQNQNRKIDSIDDCMDVVKDEKGDGLNLLQVFQLKDSEVCDFDGDICNTITIRQDNTCIKIKEISVSQLPYPVKSEPGTETESPVVKPVKKEAKTKVEKPKIDKPKADKVGAKKVKAEKSEKPEKPEKPKKKPKAAAAEKPKVKPKVSPKAKPKTGRVAKRPRVASLNAIAKVHCLYENETKSALIDSLPASALAAAAAAAAAPVATLAPTSKAAKNEPKAEVAARKGKRTSKRTTPGLKSVGRHWDMHDTSSTNSSSSGGDDAKYEPPKSAKRTKKQPAVSEADSSDDEEESGREASSKQVASPSGGSKRKRRNADTVTMDLKDMVVKKRMASLNASAILAASYSTEKKSPAKGADSSKKSTTSSDVSSVRSEPEDDAEDEDSDGNAEPPITARVTVTQPTPLPPILPPPSSQLAVIVNQDTDVTITGVYVNSTTRSTRHEEFCTISGLQYRISSTSHTQTEATAVATETLLHAEHALTQPPSASAPPQQQPAAPRPSYAPLTALSSMQPPGTPGGELHPHQRRHHHHHHHGGAPYSSAFSAPPPPPPQPPTGPPQANGSSSDASSTDKHEPAPPPPPPPPLPYAHGYYQPAGPLITHHILPHHLHLHHPPHVKSSLVPPLVPTPPSSTGTAAPPQTETSDTEVVPARSTSSPTPPGYHRGYPQQSSYHPPPISSYYPSPPASANLQYPPPPPQVPQHHYLPEPNPCAYPGPHHQPGYFHHSRSSPYHHIAYHHRRPAPYNPTAVGPPTYYHEYYGHPPGPPAAPPGSPGQQQQMLVAARAGDRPDHHPPQQPDPYPAPQPLYYSPYGGPPGPSCYPPAPPRTYVDPAYHSCPCPMQSCPNPKNVHTGPLTGAVSKGPKHHSTTVVTLPPVALALPQEPPRALGPPSPARGSAGVSRPARSGSSCSPSKQVPWCMSPLSPARASVQHLAPQSPAMLAAKNPTSEWNTTEEKCDATGLLAIGKVLSQSVLGLEQPIDDHQPEIVPKIEPVDDDVSASYYTLKVDTTDEDRESVDEQQTTIDLSTKPREYHETTTTTVYCDPTVNHNNNNVDGDDNNKAIMKGSAKRKKPNPMQIVSAKKSKFQDEPQQHDHAEGETIQSTTTAADNNDGRPPSVQRNDDADLSSATDDKCDEPVECVNSNEQIVRSALTDESDADEMVGETFVKKKNVPKKTKRGRKDRKNGNHKKELTDAMKRERDLRMCEEFAQLSRLKKQDLAPRWSNGWMWQGKPSKRPVYLENDDVPVLRKCYPCMRHMQGDTIYARDCVLLKSGSRKNDLPFIAKISNLWEDPVNGEMMMSLMWYYRPEHTKQGRQKADMPDELFASKHRDVNSVACIDDRCYVLTFNEYCRYRKHMKSVQENLVLCKAVVPPLIEANPRARQLPAEGAPADLIFFCRRVYDCRQKRLLKKQSL
ncbi:proteoglycan 4-like [Adelges cooleyi]|uniref:proteoglycan 4-like n=1 Tax=Adelges cooleyi TaxID=133065 RepID=UPI00217F34BA|nr:proteoglycan 4-like [Adelges cooleyi]